MAQVSQSAQGLNTSAAAAAAAAQNIQALPLLVGLTGSIGMGKSTVSGFISAANIPVLSADDVVHKLYAAGGAAVAPVGAAFPDAVVAGAVDRVQLSKYVVGNEDAMRQLEALVHPLVEAERLKFVQQVCTPCLML
jgi:dephospho-CoA kinase